MVAIPDGIKQFIVAHIKGNAYTCLAKLAIHDYDPEGLYRELLGDDEVYSAFVNAARFLPYEHFERIVDLPNENFRVSVFLTASTAIPQYLVPVRGFRPTPESNLMHMLDANNQMARDWQTTITLFDMFSGLDARIVGFLFPWIKDILVHCDWFKAEAKYYGYGNPPKNDFKYQWDLSKVNDKIIDHALAQLIEGKPVRFPSLTSEVNQACRLGLKLFAQAKILSNTSIHAGTTRITSVMGDHLFPVPLLIQVREILNEWNQQELARTTKVPKWDY